MLVTAFVEGRMPPGEFEVALGNHSRIEALLDNDPDRPSATYVGRSLYLYLLQLDYGTPGGVVDAQGALIDWLKRHHVAHVPSPDPATLIGLIHDAQPQWLSLESGYIQEQFLSRSGGRTGQVLSEWLRDELLQSFRYVGKPPRWIQSPEWPIGAEGPLVFIGQLKVEKYFHDVACAYVFHDPSSGQCETILQVA